MNFGRAFQFTGTGSIGTGEVIMQGLILTPGAAVANVDIKEGGTNGTVVLSLQAGNNLGSTVVDTPITIKDPYLSSISGSGAKLTVVM